MVIESPKKQSVGVTIWHCNLSAELTKNALLQTVFFDDFVPTGVALNVENQNKIKKNQHRNE